MKNANVINRSRVRAPHAGRTSPKLRLPGYSDTKVAPEKLLVGDIRDLSSIRTLTRAELR